MAKDAYRFLVPLLLLMAASAFLQWPVAAAVFLLLGAFVVFFFRDPNRSIPVDPGAIVSPADGRVVRVSSDAEGTWLGIFLSVFDVHINRAPVAGRISGFEYRKGKFLLAFDERASIENEQLRLRISGEEDVRFNLIAGLVARRIVPWVKQGDEVGRGDRIGLIRFGSRVDIHIPPGFDLKVERGSRVRGGSTILALRRTMT